LDKIVNSASYTKADDENVSLSFDDENTRWNFEDSSLGKIFKMI